MNVVFRDHLGEVGMYSTISYDSPEFDKVIRDLFKVKPREKVDYVMLGSESITVRFKGSEKEKETTI